MTCLCRQGAHYEAYHGSGERLIYQALSPLPSGFDAPKSLPSRSTVTGLSGIVLCFVLAACMAILALAGGQRSGSGERGRLPCFRGERAYLYGWSSVM